MYKLLVTILLFLSIKSFGQRQHLIFESSFEDTTLSDWSSIEECSIDRVSTSSYIKKVGNRSARFYSTVQDTLGCSLVRSQLLFNDINQINYERWYGFSIYLGPSYPINYDGVENILQFLRTDTLEEYHPLSIGYHGYAQGISELWPSGKYLTITRVLRTNPPASPYTIFINPIQTVNNQNWVDIVMRVKWSNDTTGRIRIWINDVLRYSYNGITNYGPNKLRIGIDKWDWRLKWDVSNTTEREIYIDEFRIGDSLSTYNDVRPGFTTALPIRWYNFTGIRVNQGVKLKCEAEFGDNFEKFIVERNINNKWEEIGTVYKNSTNEYEFIDKYPKNLNYYRIKAINSGEPDSYTKIISVRYGNNKPIKVSVYNLLGQLIKNTQITNLNNFNDLLLKSGVYIIRYEDGQSEKIIIN